jgi:hypothetical protein
VGLKATLRGVEHLDAPVDPGAQGVVMATTTVEEWAPTKEEVLGIIAELRPVIDECVMRANRLLATTPAGRAALARRAG